MSNQNRSSRISVAIADGNNCSQIRCQQQAYRVDSANDRLTINPIGDDEWGRGDEIQFRLQGQATITVRAGSSEFAMGVPSAIQCGEYSIEASIQDEGKSLDLQHLTPLRRIGRRGRHVQDGMPVPSAAALGFWFEALGALQSYPTNSRDLFTHVAKAIINPGGLDAASVLTVDSKSPRKIRWQTRSYDVRTPPIGLTIVDSIVEYAIRERTAVVTGTRPSIFGGAIAAPFYDENDDVAGILYGLRALTSENRRVKIRPLEACWIQVVAESLTAGLKRFSVEQKEARTRFIYGRSFSPPLLEAFQRDPDILHPQQRNITVMFADLRNFTSITEQIGSERAFELLTDVMNRWTTEVMNTDGVVLDFYGDGLAAMWNAPTDQPDHARRACRTALAIQRVTRDLKREWERKIGENISSAIGIASGDAFVGNAGSDLRLKYGPRGSTVNFGSRLESAAKKLAVPILISDATKRQLDEAASTRRIGKAALPGLSECHDVHELLSSSQTTDNQMELFTKYEQALEHFEHERYDQACELLEALIHSESRIGGAESLHEAASAKPSDLMPSIRLVPVANSL